MVARKSLLAWVARSALPFDFEFRAQPFDFFLFQFDIVGHLLESVQRLRKGSERHEAAPSRGGCHGLEIEFAAPAVGFSPDIGLHRAPPAPVPKRFRTRGKRFRETEIAGQVDRSRFVQTGVYNHAGRRPTAWNEPSEAARRPRGRTPQTDRQSSSSVSESSAWAFSMRDDRAYESLFDVLAGFGAGLEDGPPGVRQFGPSGSRGSPRFRADRPC